MTASTPRCCDAASRGGRSSSSPRPWRRPWRFLRHTARGSPRPSRRHPGSRSIWLRGQSCGGDGQAFLQASDPTIGQMLIELLSVDYSDALMAPSGAAAERSRTDALAVLPARYIAVVEGCDPDGCGRDLVPHRRACLQRRRPRGVRGCRGDDRRRLVRVRWRGERGARGHDIGLRASAATCPPAGWSICRAAR